MNKICWLSDEYREYFNNYPEGIEDYIISKLYSRNNFVRIRDITIYENEKDYELIIKYEYLAKNNNGRKEKIEGIREDIINDINNIIDLYFA